MNWKKLWGYLFDEIPQGDYILKIENFNIVWNFEDDKEMVVTFTDSDIFGSKNIFFPFMIFLTSFLILGVDIFFILLLRHKNYLKQSLGFGVWWKLI